MSEQPPVLTEVESGLFSIINQSLEPSSAQRWQELIELRDQRQLTEEQLAELRSLGDQLEALNVQRFEAIEKLAKLRGVKFDALCRQLEILPN